MGIRLEKGWQNGHLIPAELRLGELGECGVGLVGGSLYHPQMKPLPPNSTQEMQIYMYNSDDFDSLGGAIRQKRIIAAMAVFFQENFVVLQEHKLGAVHATPHIEESVKRRMKEWWWWWGGGEGVVVLAEVEVEGVSMEIGSHNLPVAGKDNPAVDPIIHGLRGVVHHEKETFLEPFVLKDLLPASLGSYYRYTGSLTTPPCSKAVEWILFSRPLYVSSKQHVALHSPEHTLLRPPALTLN
ncbi:hypothetical protein CRUP_011699 [Coryphaenoides rupestris]|nr:hypothetical protein CRUP_011699 [Coryphaenoides rupestris]